MRSNVSATERRFSLPSSVLVMGLALIVVLKGAGGGPATAVEVTSAIVRGGGPSGSGVQVDVTLRNLSKQIVTAWTYKVEAHYADNTVRQSGGSVDDINALSGPDLSLAFRPGSSRSFELRLPAGSHGDPPTNVVATLTMVAFADQTAMGDPVEIRRAATRRKSMASANDEELSALELALSSPTPKQAVREAMTAHESKHPGHPQSGLGLSGQILALTDQGVPTATLKSFVAKFREQQTLLAKHSTLKEVE